MDEKKTKPTTERGESKPEKPQGSVLSDKDRFGHSGADEKLRHMGEKVREAEKGKE